MATHLKDTFAPVFISDNELCRNECIELFTRTYRGVSTAGIEAAFRDTTHLFSGRYPGYRNSDTPYHDLGHTMAVTLAVMRMIAGSAFEGEVIGSGYAELALFAALFHDAGLIPRHDEQVRSGAELIQGHEDRSAAFAAEYLRERGYDSDAIVSVRRMIACTALQEKAYERRFSSGEQQSAAYIVGSADLIAQMSDRSYLEKLPLLFLELRDAGVDVYQDPYDLLTKTPGFYASVVQPRLERDFKNVARYAKAYFTWFENRHANLYTEYIAKNLSYLSIAIERGPDGWWTMLRREGIVDRALDRLTA